MTAKTSYLLTLLLALSPLGTLGADSPSHGIASDFRESEGFHQMLVIGPEFLSTDALKSLFNERKHPSDHVFKIDAVESREDAAHMGGEGASDQEFGDWERRYRAVENRDTFHMMRLVAIGKNVVIETVNGLKTSREIVSGRDPLLFEENGRQCRILEIHWSRPKIAQRHLNVTIDLQTDVLPDVADAKEITKDIQRQLDYPWVFTQMRTDTWFIDDDLFPLWFPFELGQKPPTFKEYVSRGTMRCIGSPDVQCSRSIR